jgi:hypothetical protein
MKTIAFLGLVCLLWACEPDKDNPAPEKKRTLKISKSTIYSLNNEIIGYQTEKADSATGLRISFINYDENRKVTLKDTFEYDDQGRVLTRKTDYLYNQPPYSTTEKNEYDSKGLKKSSTYRNESLEYYYTVEYDSENQANKYLGSATDVMLKITSIPFH